MFKSFPEPPLGGAAMVLLLEKPVGAEGLPFVKIAFDSDFFPSPVVEMR